MQHLTRTELKAVLDISLVAGSALATQQLGTAIALIGKQRVSDMFHVSTYLMGTTSFEDTLHQCYIAITFHHLVMGYGWFSYL
jgi:hypothetical protein